MGRSAPTTPAGQAYANAPLPSGRSDWRAAGWAVVDLETTGLDPRSDEIISIAVVPVDGGRARPGDALYRTVRPERPPTAASIRIHGIRPADLDAAPPLADVLDDVLTALTGRLLVAHAAFVEHGFLEPALAARGLRLRGEILDTRELARVWLAGSDPATVPPLLELGALAGRLGLPVHRPHHALGDALTTAQAFLALASHLEHRGRLPVKTLLALQRGARHQRR
jgi:DNA polymerase-3 subunit epsilon